MNAVFTVSDDSEWSKSIRIPICTIYIYVPVYTNVRIREDFKAQERRSEGKFILLFHTRNCNITKDIYTARKQIVFRIIIFVSFCFWIVFHNFIIWIYIQYQNSWKNIFSSLYCIEKCFYLLYPRVWPR